MLLVVLPMPGLKRLVPPNRSKNERSVMEQLERYRSVTYRGEFERLAKSKLREPPGLPPLHTSASTPVWEELILTPHPLLLDAWGNLLRKVCMPAKMSRVSACSAPTSLLFAKISERKIAAFGGKCSNSSRRRHRRFPRRHSLSPCCP